MLSSDQLSDMIRKRFEIRVNPTLTETANQGHSDGDGFGEGYLYDTIRGKNAGQFAFTESIPDLDELMVDADYAGNLSGRVDKLLENIREQEGPQQSEFDSIVRDLVDNLQSSPFTPDQTIPIIHGGLNSGYRGQGLYRNLILPSMIDYFGEQEMPMGSGRKNRSKAATRAHNALQNKNDSRIKHTRELPFNQDWGSPERLIDMITDSRLEANSELLEDFIMGLPEQTYIDLSGIRESSPVDIYQSQLGSKVPDWGDLRPSPRRIPVIEQDWDQYRETGNSNQTPFQIANQLANRAHRDQLLNPSSRRWGQNRSSQFRMLDEFDRDFMKSFPLPEYWHGTSVANAKKILEEGLDPYSFGSPHEEDAENYAEYHDAPAILGFDTDEGHTLLDPHNEGYDFGTSDYGHVIVGERVPPELIRLFAMGHEGISDEAWSELLRVLNASDRLSRQYPDIDEAYNEKR